MTIDTPSVAVLLALLAACAVTDILTAKVYNALTYPAILVGFGLAATGARGVESAAAGFAIGAALLLTAWACGGVGLGDAKLAMAVGALTNAVFTVQTIVYSALVAAAMGLMIVIINGEFLITMRRLAVAAGFAKSAPALPPRMMPGGFCLCLGGVWTLLEHWNRTTLWDWAVRVMGV